MSQVTITNSQKVKATLSAKKSDGTDATILASVWSIISGDGSVDPSPELVWAYLVSGDAFADTVVQVLVTADFGSGVISVPLNITLTVVPVALPPDASISASFGIPQPK